MVSASLVQPCSELKTWVISTSGSGQARTNDATQSRAHNLVSGIMSQSTPGDKVIMYEQGSTCGYCYVLRLAVSEEPVFICLWGSRFSPKVLMLISDKASPHVLQVSTILGNLAGGSHILRRLGHYMGNIFQSMTNFSAVSLYEYEEQASWTKVWR